MRLRFLTRSQWCLARSVSTAITRSAADRGLGNAGEFEHLRHVRNELFANRLELGLAVVRLVGRRDARLVSNRGCTGRTFWRRADHGAKEAGDPFVLKARERADERDFVGDAVDPSRSLATGSSPSTRPSPHP